jgi:hypothetical protein
MFPQSARKANEQAFKNRFEFRSESTADCAFTEQVVCSGKRDGDWVRQIIQLSKDRQFPQSSSQFIFLPQLSNTLTDRTLNKPG